MLYNGVYTITSEQTGQHRTFRVKTQKENARFAPGERVVSMLNGPDNTSNYYGFGFVKEHGIIVWKSRRTDKFPKYAEVLWDLATNGSEGKYGPLGFTLHLEKECIRCNRRLTNPESLKTGIGPECAKHV